MKDNFDVDNIMIGNVLDDDAEFIPLLSPDDEQQINAEETPNELRILPLRNTVSFPGVVLPITIGRDKSIKLIQDANKGDKTLGVVSQKNDDVEDPMEVDLN